MKEYTVRVISELIYEVIVRAEDEDEAEHIARYEKSSCPCIVRLKKTGEEFQGFINDVWSGSDVEVIGEK